MAPVFQISGFMNIRTQRPKQNEMISPDFDPSSSWVSTYD